MGAKDSYDTLSEAHIQTGHEAKRMIIFSEEKFPPLTVGDTITLSVPTVNGGPLYFNNIFGGIRQFNNNVCRVG